MSEITEVVQNLGLSDKAAKIYLAALRLGEATVLQLAREAGVKRTTIYYTLDELKQYGALVETKRSKKVFYLPITPRELLKIARGRLSDFEESLSLVEEQQSNIYKKPRMYFLSGPAGFKQVWNMIFDSKDKEYRIITAGESFLDFIREKYVVDEIIKNKKKLNISSKQIIVDSPYARKIIAKDLAENRISKILPASYKLPFTEIICNKMVAFLSSKFDNTFLVIENEAFVRTRKSLFDALWNNLA